MKGQTFFLFENGDSVQKILHQPEWAQPAADEAPKEASEEEEKSKRDKRYLQTPLVQQCLQGPDGTRGNGTWAGVAVKPWYTGIF